MRLDSFIFEQRHAQSRNKAAELIAEGSVWVNGSVERKNSREISDADVVEVTKITQYVSRAGLKLRGFVNEQKALHVKGRDVLDIGSSTGCMKIRIYDFLSQRKLMISLAVMFHLLG